ncbi:MAG: hypothetical protein Q7T13_16915, partial [Polaromonas sp.]|nr:hypothetical protein [Polaromonas sp.]
MRPPWSRQRAADTNKSVGEGPQFSAAAAPRSAREARRAAAAQRFSLGIFRFSEVNQQQKRPKKKRFPYETVVFSSSIP